MRALMPLLILTALASGCLENISANRTCPQPGLWTLSGPLTDEGRITRGFTQGTGILVWTNNTHNDPATLYLEGMTLPSNQQIYADTFAGSYRPVPSGFLEFARLRLDQPERSIEGVRVNSRLYVADGYNCGREDGVSVDLTFADPAAGKIVKPGQGALVRTAGFWTNGTLFYTNIERVHTNTHFPRGGWYEYTDDAPLKVYVYNSTRTELPKRYAEAGYGTTIPGFNLALRTMETPTSRALRIEPAQAYTRPGNENHPLYGDALVFYIEVVDVTAVPCKI
ncbi:MAG TPA: hypothetical protein VI818_08080, partial [Candidatus Thermoplasmatota archaeon]|nr:hypothetical protein [Candidatus Thermoplasmatota archaeon]